MTEVAQNDGTIVSVQGVAQFVAITCGDPDRRAQATQRARTLLALLVGDTPTFVQSAGHTAVVGFGRPDRPLSDPVSDATNGFAVFAGTPIQTHGTTKNRNMQLPAERALDHLANELSRWDGQFALLVHPGHGNAVFIATDPLGQLHVYRAETGGALFHATSSLLLGALTQADFDDSSIREFLARGNCFENRSLFRGVRKLEGGQILTLDTANLEPPRRYWSLEHALPGRNDSTARVRDVHDSLIECIGRIRNQYSRPGYDLTGGLDSRIIYGAALKTGAAAKIHTTVAGHESDPDVRCAERIAHAYGSPHHTVAPLAAADTDWWAHAAASLALTDGEYDLLEYAAIRNVQSVNRASFDLSVNGSGGGLLQGYWWELLPPPIDHVGDFPFDRLAAERLAPDTTSDRLLDHAFEDSLVEHFARIARVADRPVAALPNMARMDHLLLRMRIQRWQGRLASSTSRYQNVVSPFLLRPVMAAILRVPARERYRGAACRRLLHELDPALTRLPLADGTTASPRGTRAFTNAATMGARALGRRLRARVSNPTARARAARIERLLSAPQAAARLDPKRMRTGSLYKHARLVAVIEKARTGNASATAQLGRILTLEHTARTLADVGGHSPSVDL